MLRVNWIQAHTTHKPTYIWTNRTLIETEKQKTKNLNLEKIDEHKTVIQTKKQYHIVLH